VEGVEIVIMYIIVRNKMIPAHLRVRIRNLRNDNHVKYNTKVMTQEAWRFLPRTRTFLQSPVLEKRQ
jgi:hypothetical protein